MTDPQKYDQILDPIYLVHRASMQAPLLVEALTGIFCSTCESLTGHVSRRIFDRRIDLDWFQEDQTELTRSNFQKTDFWVKNRPFLEVF